MPPLVWPFLALTSGIVAAPWLDMRYAVVSVPLACLISLRRPGFALIVLFLAGAVLANLDVPIRPSGIRDDGLPRRVVLRLARPPEARGDAVYFLADLREVDGAPVPPGRARLTWFRDDYGSGAVLDDLALGRGDVLEVLVRLRRPDSFRNPGGFDYGAYLARQGIYWTGTIRSPRLITIRKRGWHGADRVRDWTADRIAAYFPNPTTRSLVLGMVLGKRRLLPPEDDRRFKEAGLIHLLVVSGFNLAVVAGAASFLGRRLFGGRWLRAVFALILIFGYAFLVEGDAPVVRATLMASLLVTARALDRGYNVGNSLAGTALAILAFDPYSLEDASFLLSFGAVAAILLIGAPAVSWTHRRVHEALRDPARTELDKYLDDAVVDRRVALRLGAELGGWPLGWFVLPRRLLAVVTEVAVITLGIQVFLLPVAIESFHRVAPVSVPLNVLGAGIATLVTPAGLVLVIVPDLIGSPLAWILARLLDLLVASVALALELPGATLRVPSAPPGLWIAFAPCLGWLAIAIRRRQVGPAGKALAVVTSLVVAMTVLDFSPSPPREPVLTFLDVGQGDSALVEMPDGSRVVVDGGGLISSGRPEEGGFRVGEDVVSQYLFDRRFRRIDTLVLTHAHHDHMDGLFDLIRNFEIGEIWLGPSPPVPRYRELLGAIGARGIPIRQVRAGDRLGAFRVLYPDRQYQVGNEVRNDDSLVLLLEWRGRTALLTGDLERALDVGPESVDVLKVPHHGSRNTRLRVRARVPVISVGANNRFGHPDPSRLPALRTDLLGAIEVTLSETGPSVRFPGLR